MTYTWRTIPELLWAGFVAAVVVLLMAITDTQSLESWQGWVQVVGAAMARAAAAAILAELTRRGITRCTGGLASPPVPVDGDTPDRPRR